MNTTYGQRLPLQRSVVYAALGGLTASFFAMIDLSRAVKAQLKAGQLYSSEIAKDPLYYGAHAIELSLLLCAGILALRATRPGAVVRGYLFRLVLLFAAGLLMAARGYSTEALLSTKLADATGPLACLISVAVYIGVRRANWVLLDRAFLALGVVLSAVSIYCVASLQTSDRQEAVSSMNLIVNASYWPAAWTALREYMPGARSRYWRFVPMGVYGLASLFLQTRLNFVMFFALFAMCVYVDHRRGVRQIARWATAIGACAWALLFVLVFLGSTSVYAKLEASANAFYSRLDEDTRSGQLEWFARDVEPQELLLGRGSLATWTWGATAWNGGTDIGYLSLLFFGGVPLLATYIAVHIAPAFGVLKRGPTSLQLAAACIVLLWAVRMFSSSYPGLALEYYPVLLCVGACISREK